MRNQLLVYLLIFSCTAGAYSDYSYSAFITVNPDGTSHVTEKTIFLFENAEERRAFEINMNLGQSTIAEWRKFSDNIKFHLKGAIYDVRITAKREFSVSFEAGTVIIEYDITNAFSNYTEGSRRTHYLLNNDALAFERTQTGQISLGNNVLLQFQYPKGAELIRAEPKEAREINENIVSYRGPLTGNLGLEFVEEIPLSQEVGAFFITTYGKAVEKLPLIMLAAFSLLVFFVLVKFGRK